MALIFYIKVVPRSGRNAWKLDKSGMLKCYLKSAPEKGLANKELIKTVARVLSVTQGDVEIIAGATRRNKRLKVNLDISFDQLLAILGVERQRSLFE